MIHMFSRFQTRYYFPVTHLPPHKSEALLEVKHLDIYGEIKIVWNRLTIRMKSGKVDHWDQWTLRSF